MDQKKIVQTRIPTWNPMIRSKMPYLLGHGANYEWYKVE